MYGFVTGSVINIDSGEWISGMSGIGAGIDSLYEYLLKVHNKDFLHKRQLTPLKC